VPIELVSRPFTADPNKPFPAVICPEVRSQECCSPSSPRQTSQTEASQERASLCE
jgi:hypothetical protein